MNRGPGALVALCASVGCSSTPPPRPPTPSPMAMSTARGVGPAMEAEASLARDLGLASGSLPDTGVAQLLHARLELPQQVVVASLYLPPRNLSFDWWSYRAPHAELTPALADSLSAVLARLPRVGRAASLPSFVVGDRPTFAGLQEAGARFQADLLLVYRPRCRVYEDAPVFGRVTYQSTCTFEAILLDTRTGVIPLAATATRVDATRRQRRDRDSEDTVRRVQFAATLAAAGEVVAKVGVWLASVTLSTP
jgi:hypothetical protein